MRVGVTLDRGHDTATVDLDGYEHVARYCMDGEYVCLEALVVDVAEGVTTTVCADELPEDVCEAVESAIAAAVERRDRELHLDDEGALRAAARGLR